MDEEKILQRGFDIKKSKRTYSPEEAQIIDKSNFIIAHRSGVLISLDKKVGEISDKVLRPVDHPLNWQPSDHLPDFSGEWEKEIKEIQEQSRALPDSLLVILVGDMITEEGLPTYQSLINKPDVVRDLTGKQDTAWAKWTRGWTAEENRHGDLLHAHLGFNPRLVMPHIERDIQHLVRSGFDPGMGEDPYKMVIYTSFQEPATYTSHKGTAKIAVKYGDQRLHDLCMLIAKDEQRHYTFYKSVMKEIFVKDPNGAMTAYGRMMKKMISMPAKEMSNRNNPALFTDFAALAQATGVYTTEDYAGIIDELNEGWNISTISVTTPEAAKAQEHLMALSGKYRAFADKNLRKKFEFDVSKFDWIRS